MHPVSIQAASVSPQVIFSDDFSSDLSKWQPTRDNGQYWSVENGKAKATIIRRGFTITELVPKDTYWNPAWKDLEYSYQITPVSGVDHNISFNVQNLQTWFEVHLLPTFFNVVSVRNSNHPLDINHPFVIENGKTYNMKIQFYKGNVKVFINGLQISDDTDNSFVDQYGKIGLKASTGADWTSSVLFDNVEVRLITDEQQLGVPVFKQSDPLWRDIEFDHAETWSDNPTFRRWGCAITSLAMIFRYHGIQYLPDGQTITPETLNDWLKNQPDGFIGGGYLNWPAAMRLTSLISAKYSTPKLEYTAVPGSALTKAITEIRNLKPVVMEIDGHFLVGSGVTADGKDVLINDPAYTYTLFSQHKTPLVSTRVFTPSNTDLSYLVVAVPTNVKVELLDEQNRNIPGVFIEQKPLKAVDDIATYEKAPAVKVLTLAKPTSGTYQLRFSSVAVQQATITIFAYQQDGTVSDESFSDSLGPIARTVDVTFSKEAASHQQLRGFSTQQVSQTLFWLRSYLPKSFFTNITDLEHQVAEVQFSSAQLQADVLRNVRDQLNSVLTTLPQHIKSYVLRVFPPDQS